MLYSIRRATHFKLRWQSRLSRYSTDALVSASYGTKSIIAIGRLIGLDLYNYKGKLIYKTDANPNGVVRFRPAGSPKEGEIDISIFEIEEIIYGKEDYT